MTRTLALLVTPLIFASCASSTNRGAVDVERRQLFLLPESKINAMSAQAYEQTKKEAAQKGALDQNAQEVARVKAVAKRIIPQTGVFRKDAPGWRWEVHVITSPELNAYCMPGGKIIFYSSIIEKLKLDDAEIAAIMGHEIAHALREHGRERMSEALVDQLGVDLIMKFGKIDTRYAGALGMLTNLVITLPHSRGQESEADEIGLELMARAGYDPREALQLWKKMSAAAGGQKPPEILSTHPADSTRIKQIEAWLPKVLPLYEKSK